MPMEYKYIVLGGGIVFVVGATLFLYGFLTGEEKSRESGSIASAPEEVLNIDSDGDSSPDWLEIIANTDPNDIKDFPKTIEDELGVDEEAHGGVAPHPIVEQIVNESFDIFLNASSEREKIVAVENAIDTVFDSFEKNKSLEPVSVYVMVDKNAREVPILEAFRNIAKREQEARDLYGVDATLISKILLDSNDEESRKNLALLLEVERQTIDELSALTIPPYIQEEFTFLLSKKTQSYDIFRSFLQHPSEISTLLETLGFIEREAVRIQEGEKTLTDIFESIRKKLVEKAQ